MQKSVANLWKASEYWYLWEEIRLEDENIGVFQILKLIFHRLPWIFEDDPQFYPKFLPAETLLQKQRVALLTIICQEYHYTVTACPTHIFFWYQSKSWGLHLLLVFYVIITAGCSLSNLVVLLYYCWLIW